MAGRSWSRTLVACGTTLLSLYMVAGCNAVLGIEQAQLDDSPPGQTCGWPPADPLKECTQVEQAAGNCSIDECLKDQACRKTLAVFRKCAGDSCSDSEACQGCTAGNALAEKTAKCLSGFQSNLAKAATLCESYCSCMDTRCHQTEPGGAKSACVEACENGLPTQPPLLRGKVDPTVAAVWQTGLPPWMTYCFWQHCERGLDPDDATHCNHAIGESQPSICPMPVNDPSASLCPFGKSYGNGPCNTNDDCCSGACLASKVCAP